MESKDIRGLGGLRAPAAYRRDRQDSEDDGKERRQHLWQEAMDRSNPRPQSNGAPAAPVTGVRPIAAGLPPLPQLLAQIHEDASEPLGIPGDAEIALKRFRKALREALAARGLNEAPNAEILQDAVSRAVAHMRADPGLPGDVLETVQTLASRLRDPAAAARVLRGGLGRDDGLSDLLA